MSRWERLALPVLLVVAALHFVLMKLMDTNGPDFRGAALFYLLFPGEVANLVITGAHGGTRAQDLFGEILGIAINTWAWVLVLMLIGKLRRRMRRRDHSA